MSQARVNKTTLSPKLTAVLLFLAGLAVFIVSAPVANASLESQQEAVKEEATQALNYAIDSISAASAAPSAQDKVSKANEAASKLNDAIAHLEAAANAAKELANQYNSAGKAPEANAQLAKAVQASDAAQAAKGKLDEAKAQIASNKIPQAASLISSTAKDIESQAKALGGVTSSVASSGSTPAASGGPAGGSSNPVSPGASYALTNPLGTDSIPAIMGKVIGMFMGVVGALALAVFVYGGILYMTSRDNQEQAKKAMDSVKYAVLGLIIIGFAYTLSDSFILLWTSNPIPAETTTRTGEQPTTAQGEKAEVTTEVQAKTAEEDKAKKDAELKAYAEKKGCNTLIHEADPTETATFSCQAPAGVQVCIPVTPNPCPDGQSCCAD